MDHIQYERINETAPVNIHLSTKLGALRDATHRWIINRVRHLSTSPPNNPDDLGYIGFSSWKKCRVGRWDLFHESITSDTAFCEWLEKPAEFQAEIEGFELLHPPSKLHLEEDKGEAVDGKDDEDVPVELSTLVAIRRSGQSGFTYRV